MTMPAERKLAFEHGKISYLGEQLKPIPTALFSLNLPPEKTLELFVSSDPSHQLYPNDPLPYTRHFSVDTEEITRIRRITSTLVTQGTLTQTQPVFLSFSVLTPLAEGWEFIEFGVDRGPHRRFYEDLIAQLAPNNTFGLAALRLQLDNLPL